MRKSILFSNYWLWVVAYLVFTFTGPLWILWDKQVDLHADFHTAKRVSAKVAPDPLTNSEAVVQVYYARTFNWRGMFASHTWIATKQKNAKQYTVYQMIGWR